MIKRVAKKIKEYGIYLSFLRFLKKINYKIISIINIFERKHIWKHSKDYKELKSIITDKKYKTVFIFHPFVIWNLPAFQRPQQIASALAKEKDVLYIYCTPDSEKDKFCGLFKKISSNLILTVDYEFVERIKRPNKVVQFYSTNVGFNYKVVETALKYKNKVLYEYIDGIDKDLLGKIPKYYIERHKKVMSNENIFVIASADKLIKDVKKYRKNNFALVCNGVVLSDFKSNIKKPPQELEKIKKEYDKVVCYYGALASWFDYELLKKCAKKYPEYAFILIGIDFDETLEKSGVLDNKNVFYLGKVKYNELINYTKFTDLLTIPFVINHITESTSPVKLFEYMATQKPILTTAMPECKKYMSAIIGENHDDYVEKIEVAIKLANDKEYLKTEMIEAEQNTWESKAKEILDLINTEEQHETND